MQLLLVLEGVCTCSSTNNMITIIRFGLCRLVADIHRDETSWEKCLRGNTNSESLCSSLLLGFWNLPCHNVEG